MARKITIPFHRMFDQLLADGKKIQTARTRKYGDPGDWFEWNGHRYEITRVFQATMHHIVCCYFPLEGFDEPNDLRDCFTKQIGLAYRPDRLLWVHRFKRSHSP